MGTLRSKIIRLAFAQSQLRSQLLPLLVEDTTDPEEIFSRVLGALTYLRSLNVRLRDEFDRFRLETVYKPSTDQLKKAQQGSEMARSARLAMADLIDLFPTDNKYVLAWTEANRLDVAMAERMEEAKVMLKSSR